MTPEKSTIIRTPLYQLDAVQVGDRYIKFRFRDNELFDIEVGILRDLLEALMGNGPWPSYPKK